MSAEGDLDQMLNNIRQHTNRHPLQDCGHSVYSAAKIAGVGIVCLECDDTEWEMVTDPLDGPISLFRRKDAR